jgi:hypothetical protein
MVTNFKQIVNFMPPGDFTMEIQAKAVFAAPATSTQTVNLSLEGTVAFIYIQVYKEAYPTNPTPTQIERINEIWVGLGYPENVLPS